MLNNYKKWQTVFIFVPSKVYVFTAVFPIAKFPKTATICIIVGSVIRGSRRINGGVELTDTKVKPTRVRDKGNLDASPGHDWRLLQLLPDPGPSRSISFRTIPRHSVGITSYQCESERHFARSNRAVDRESETRRFSSLQERRWFECQHRFARSIYALLRFLLYTFFEVIVMNC